LEVVDTRASPEAIVAVLKEGAVVGELAFLDGSPRSIDVRAGEECAVLRWAHRDLRALLKREPAFASAFYETVAQLAAARMRRITDTAVAGMVAAEDVATRGGSRAEAEARALAEQVKSALLRSETSLREDPNDHGAEAALRDEFLSLQTRLDQLLQAWPDATSRNALTDVLQRELHPYLVRSTLADRSIRRPQGLTATAEILTHVYVDRATGRGPPG
jgi:CRP-like cAMP-binding protein